MICSLSVASVDRDTLERVSIFAWALWSGSEVKQDVTEIKFVDIPGQLAVWISSAYHERVGPWTKAIGSHETLLCKPVALIVRATRG